MARKAATIDEFIEAGAYYKLFKAIAAECVCNIPRLIHGKASDTDRLMKIANKIDRLEVDIGLEQYLDIDHHELPTSEFTCFFYGSPNIIRNEIDEKINKKAIEIMDKLLKPKGDYYG